MFDGFAVHRFERDGVALHARVGGQGAPLLLMHCHPQTHVVWHLGAPALAARGRVVALDLRRYGASPRPVSSADHATYARRTMAQDALHVMRALGHERFDVLAHDRGARVAHRLALDSPQAVGRTMLLDIAPTLAMYRGTSEAFARAYWHWFFLIQPPPLPERLIEADPRAYVRDVMGRRHAGLGVFAPEALAEYERCVAQDGSAHAICEDYRASASIDLEHDEADRARGLRVPSPLRVLWGEHGAVGRCFDVLASWREAASNVTGRALPCGHYLAEERPADVVAEALEFLADPTAA